MSEHLATAWLASALALVLAVVCAATVRPRARLSLAAAQAAAVAVAAGAAHAVSGGTPIAALLYGGGLLLVRAVALPVLLSRVPSEIGGDRAQPRGYGGALAAALLAGVAVHVGGSEVEGAALGVLGIGLLLVVRSTHHRDALIGLLMIDSGLWLQASRPMPPLLLLPAVLAILVVVAAWPRPERRPEPSP